MEYDIATGELIPNLREKKFQAVSQQCVSRSIIVQVRAVNKALMSVKKVMRAGNRVVCIEDKVTGEKIWATDGGGMFMVKMWANRAFSSSFSIRRVGMEVRKPQEEDALKFDDEDPRLQDRKACEE